MLRSLSFIFCLAISQLAFGQKKQHVRFPPPVFDFPFTPACELPDHKNELVYTRFIYTSKGDLQPEEKTCNNIVANLYLPPNVFLDPKYSKYFKTIRLKKRRDNLIIDAIGVFGDDQWGVEHGIGDLGNNKYRFILKTVVNIDPADSGK
ncbi:hypothetical protein G7092_30055 [Mucilaginibacter sp. HC2]|uniref:hypothetical protein n=1 Tax=Mucilaginibacter inviolabilis TaxID=2714892 RepID=UPI00140E1847|nr:hypothetical protein [Mucilaginibacter inviolabilis]NHA08083.1 hypothetical protein [Mucilaginibacter inviolabilis]